MSRCLIKLNTPLLAECHTEFKTILSLLEREEDLPGVKPFPADGWMLTEDFIDTQPFPAVQELYKQFPLLRKTIRFHIHANQKGKRSGLRRHVDYCPKSDPMFGICPASLNFALEGCDSNTPTNWYGWNKWPNVKDFEPRGDVVMSHLNMEDGKIIETGIMENGNTYLFRTDRYHDAHAIELNGVRRVLVCIHFLNVLPWDDIVSLNKQFIPYNI